MPKEIFSPPGPVTVVVSKSTVQGVTRRLCHLGKKLINRFRLQPDRQQPIVEGIVEENIGKARSDHHADAVIDQSPNRMLRSTAAEVVAAQEDGGTGKAGLVEDAIRIEPSLAVIRIGFTGIEVAPVVKEIDAEAGFLMALRYCWGMMHRYRHWPGRWVPPDRVQW